MSPCHPQVKMCCPSTGKAPSPPGDFTLCSAERLLSRQLVYKNVNFPCTNTKLDTFVLPPLARSPRFLLTALSHRLSVLWDSHCTQQGPLFCDFYFYFLYLFVVSLPRLFAPIFFVCVCATLRLGQQLLFREPEVDRFFPFFLCLTCRVVRLLWPRETSRGVTIGQCLLTFSFLLWFSTTLIRTNVYSCFWSKCFNQLNFSSIYFKDKPRKNLLQFLYVEFLTTSKRVR